MNGPTPICAGCSKPVRWGQPVCDSCAKAMPGVLGQNSSGCAYCDAMVKDAALLATARFTLDGFGQHFNAGGGYVGRCPNG